MNKVGEFIFLKTNKVPLSPLQILRLILSSFLTQYWNTFHWEYIYLNFRIIFDREFCFVIDKFLLGFDIGYWLEETLKFLSYEIPEESFKYLPIYFVLKSIWIKNFGLF